MQVFRLRDNHALLLASMSKRGWSQTASCRLCEHRVEDVDHVLFYCPALEDCRSPGWGCQDRAAVLWSELSVLVEAAKLVRVFLKSSVPERYRRERAARPARTSECMLHVTSFIPEMGREEIGLSESGILPL